MTEFLVRFRSENQIKSPGSSPEKKAGDENRQKRLIWCDFGDEKSYCGFEAFMPHRFSHYKSFILECQYRQQGGSVPF